MLRKLLVCSCLMSALLLTIAQAYAAGSAAARWNNPCRPDGTCVPKRNTYGHYPTRWRRWPEEFGHAPRDNDEHSALSNEPTKSDEKPSKEKTESGKDAEQMPDGGAPDRDNPPAPLDENHKPSTDVMPELETPPSTEPAETTPGGQPPAEKTPANSIPADKAPADKAPASATPAEPGAAPRPLDGTNPPGEIPGDPAVPPDAALPPLGPEPEGPKPSAEPETFEPTPANPSEPQPTRAVPMELDLNPMKDDPFKDEKIPDGPRRTSGSDRSAASRGTVHSSDGMRWRTHAAVVVARQRDAFGSTATKEPRLLNESLERPVDGRVARTTRLNPLRTIGEEEAFGDSREVMPTGFADDGRRPTASVFAEAIGQPTASELAGDAPPPPASEKVAEGKPTSPSKPRRLNPLRSR